MLTAYCLEICRTWRINHVFAETTSDNESMRRIFQRHGFRKTKWRNGEILYELFLSEDRAEQLNHANPPPDE
jgi:RimJ/RimL family protein N-acetyltransferase